MQEIFITKEHLIEIKRRDFELEHHVDINHVQVARAIVVGNSKAMDNCIRNGSFTMERFNEMLQDQELQVKYFKMAEALDQGNKKDFKPLYNDIKDKADTFCGWLYFYNLHLETILDLDLTPRSRLYYHYEDFKENNLNFSG